MPREQTVKPSMAGQPADLIATLQVLTDTIQHLDALQREEEEKANKAAVWAQSLMDELKSVKNLRNNIEERLTQLTYSEFKAGQPKTPATKRNKEITFVPKPSRLPDKIVVVKSSQTIKQYAASVRLLGQAEGMKAWDGEPPQVIKDAHLQGLSPREALNRYSFFVQQSSTRPVGLIGEPAS